MTTAILPHWRSASLASASLKLISYNVLIPNSIDGWWIFKYYDSTNSAEASAWELRQELLKQQILACDPDVICLQELSNNSFLQDWKFLSDHGYQGVIHNKGFMRPATFYKTDILQLHTPPQHKDRVLITSFTRVVRPAEPEPEPGDEEANLEKSNDEDFEERDIFYVINCHLSAGNANEDRRVRQVHGGLEVVRKLHEKEHSSSRHNKQKKNNKSKSNKDQKVESKHRKTDTKNSNSTIVAPPRVVVCGDFNSCGQNEVHTLLTTGEIKLGKKIKKHICEPFYDVYSSQPRSTMVVAPLIQLLTQNTNDPNDPNNPRTQPNGPALKNSHTPSELLISRLHDVFVERAHTHVHTGLDNAETTANTLVLTAEDVEAFCLAINRRPGRGSEYRCMKSFLASKHLNNMAPSNPNNPNNLSSLASRSQSQTSHLVNNPNSPNKPDVKQQTHSELASEALPYSTSSTGSELEGYLTEEEFIEVYHQELQGGKYWSVRHDLSVLGHGIDDLLAIELAKSGPFAARFDYIYISDPYTSRSIRQISTTDSDPSCSPYNVLDYPESLEELGGYLPNLRHPSDHTPIGVQVPW